MQTRLFEIRDEATLIAVLAVRVSRDDGYLARRAGYGEQPQVLLTRLDGGGACHYDPYSWGASRTMTTAHAYIKDHWGALPDHSVVDVQWILGETKTPKRSESEATHGLG